jgi:hypothetical protein
MYQTYTEWLRELKINDVVLYDSRQRISGKYVSTFSNEKIVRVTNTLFILSNGAKIRKLDGREVVERNNRIGKTAT